MSRRVLNGFRGVVLAAAFLGGGIEAQQHAARGGTGPVQAQAPRQERAVRGAGVTWDFETGNLIGWQPTGRAFAFQPTSGDNPRVRQRESANHQGQYWIGTFERY